MTQTSLRACMCQKSAKHIDLLENSNSDIETSKYRTSGYICYFNAKLMLFRQVLNLAYILKARHIICRALILIYYYSYKKLVIDYPCNFCRRTIICIRNLNTCSWIAGMNNHSASDIHSNMINSSAIRIEEQISRFCFRTAYT